MKKMILTLTLTFVAIASVSAMNYEEARRQALFLTDKMAYELNLNDQQYEDCYEINLDYLLSVETADDAFGNYLAYRNADLRHILLDWQYTLFAAADYFLHPLYWHRGVWHYPIYRHYAVDRFFYGRPHVYFSYRGGHGRFHYAGGYYGNRRPQHWGGGLRGMDRGAVVHHGGGYHIGDGRRSGDGHRSGNGYHIGDGRQHGGGRSITGGRSSQGYTHPSSTRSTVYGNRDNHHGGYGTGRDNQSGMGHSSYSAGRSQGMGGGTRSGGYSAGATRNSGFSAGATRSSGYSAGATRSSGFSGGARSSGSSQGHSSRGHSSRGGR